MLKARTGIECIRSLSRAQFEENPVYPIDGPRLREMIRCL